MYLVSLFYRRYKSFSFWIIEGDVSNKLLPSFHHRLDTPWQNQPMGMLLFDLPLHTLLSEMMAIHLHS